MTDSDAVRYTGSSTRRFITADQFKAAGVKDQKVVEWNAGNDYSVPLDDLTDGALDVLKKDKAFKVPNRPAPPDAVEVDTNDQKPIVVEPPKESNADKPVPRAR